MLKVFVDLDGVLTNFKQAVKAIGAESGVMEGAAETDKLRMYKAINEAGESFWSKMNWTEDGKKLWDFLKPYRPVLLSSPGDFTDAVAGKQIWVCRELPGTTLITEKDKYIYAERNAILIDDMKDNVGAWNEAGGVGILHTDFDSTKKRLLDILEQPKMKATLAGYLRELSSSLCSLS